MRQEDVCLMSKRIDKSGARLKGGGFTKNGKDCPITAPPLAFLGFLGTRRQERAFSRLLAAFSPAAKYAKKQPREARPRRPRALPGPTCCLLALRASKPRSSQGGPPSNKNVATCAYMPHRWMDAASHQKRQWSARADIRSYLRSASSREHARILGFDGLQHAGRERPTNNKRGAGSKAVRGGRCFLRLDGAAEDGPSAHDRGSSGD